nr:hypothetical protein [Methanosarcina horonobensis]
MIKYFRARSRIAGAIGMPAFMLIFQGMGFRKVEFPGLPESIGYFQYLVPSIIGITLLFTAAYAGMSVIMDKQFGFFKRGNGDSCKQNLYCSRDDLRKCNHINHSGNYHCDDVGITWF